MLLSAAANAGHDPQPWEGVWRGTIGNEEVVVCLVFDGGGYGDYYKLKDGLTVPLKSSSNSEWLEMPWTSRFSSPTTSLMFHSISGDSITGQRSASGNAPVPIHLHHISTDSTCNSAEFDAPRIEAQKVSAGRIVNNDGRRYRGLTAADGAINGLEILDGLPSATLQRVNQDLEKLLLESQGLYFRCQTSAKNTDFSPGYVQTSDVVFWNARWLSVETLTQAACSAIRVRGYNNAEGSDFTWDLQTGKQVELSSLLPATPQLRRLLDERSSAGYDKYTCPGEFQGKDPSYAITPFVVHPTENGMAFQLTDGISPQCRRPIVLPYTDLERALGSKGRAFVESFKMLSRVNLYGGWH